MTWTLWVSDSGQQSRRNGRCGGSKNPSRRPRGPARSSATTPERDVRSAVLRSPRVRSVRQRGDASLPGGWWCGPPGTPSGCGAEWCSHMSAANTRARASLALRPSSAQQGPRAGGRAPLNSRTRPGHLLPPRSEPRGARASGGRTLRAGGGGSQPRWGPQSTASAWGAPGHTPGNRTRCPDWQRHPLNPIRWQSKTLSQTP